MVKSKIKILGLGLGVMIVLGVVYIYGVMKPTNRRDWMKGMETLAEVNISGNQVTIKNIRDNRWDLNQVSTDHLIERTIDTNNIERVWFVQEPFQFFDLVAHTYFVFDFKAGDPLVLSVEARREKDQKFSALTGMFNQYEVIYIWGTETDQTIRRAVNYDNALYMYPLLISQAGAQRLFLELAYTTHDLEDQPRFYNTLTSNCTNELAKSANKVKPGAIPFNLALILPGLADRELYKLGYIPNNQPFDQIKQKYYITQIVKQIHTQPDFSNQLRQRLLTN